MHRALCGVIASLALSLTAGAQTLTATQVRRIDSVFASFDGTTRPGCALGVGQAGASLYQRGYGMSDLQHGVPITPGSIFHVASISKQFAAFAVALLAQDGKLSLDDEVRKYITELPDYGKRITIRNLIHHTSGIRDQWELLVMAGWRYPDDLFNQKDVLDIVVRQKALNFNPGDEYLYSNAGYSLIAMIVQRVSGMTLREFSEKRIFQPLGMTSTHVHDDHAMIVPGRTSAYEGGATGWRISIPVFDTHGATSLFTTVGDLLKWQHNFEAITVGSPTLMKEALTSAILNSGKPANYGFGIGIARYRGTDAYGHGGADAGYRADVVRFPAHHLEIAVACNFAGAVPGAYARAVADIVLEGKLDPRPADTPRAAVAVSPARLAQLAGVYKAATSDQVFTLSLKEGKLLADNLGSAPLEAADESRFMARGTPLEFAGPAGAAATSVKVGTGDPMTRMPAFTPTAPQVAQFAGDYWSDELRVSYRVEALDSALVVHPFKHPADTLRPTFADAFSGGRFTVRFVRTKGPVTGFRLTGGRVRSVEFVKGRSRP